MSVEAIGWAFKKVNLDDPVTKFVLVALCNYSDDDNDSWPFVGTICKITGLSRRTVQTHLRKLEDLGLVTRKEERRANGSDTAAVYNIRVSWGGAGDAPPAGDARGGRATCAEGAQETREGGAGDAHLYEPSLEPSSEPPLETPVAKKATKPTDAEIDLIFEERFWPAYPKRAGTRGKPEAKKKFRTIIKSGADVEKIIDAAIKHAADWAPRIARKPADAQFILMAATWLNKERWDDEQGDPSDTAGGETIFDLANHFEQRVKETDNGHRNSDHGGHGLIDD